MNRTENYQLPTWEKTDRIMMDDFNDMTDKIDKGLHEAKTAAENVGTRLDQNLLLVKLGTVTVKSGEVVTQRMANLSSYNMIFARSDVTGTGTGVSAGVANGSGESVDVGVGGSFESSDVYQGLFWLFPAGGGVSCLALGAGGTPVTSASRSTMKWSSITSLTTRGYRCTGTVTFYGLKA